MTSAKHILRLAPPPTPSDQGKTTDLERAKGASVVDETAVVAAVRAGDPAAAMALYRSHQENVRRLLWQLLGPDAELDDVVQQVFLTVADSLHRLTKPGSLGSWIVGITLRTARREIRRRQRWRRHTNLAPGEVVGVTSRAAPASASDHQRVARIFRILDALPVSERIVFVLRFAEGYRLKEIATACDCSLATVKRRIQRARHQVHEQAKQDFWLAPLLEEEENQDA